MVTISLCMIVKNEERILARCLDTIADLADEVIIVDTGSTDKTKEIAARYTDQIYDFAWIDDFSAARNFAFSKAKMDFIYSADADEILDEENRQRFRFLKASLLPEIDVVQMKYSNQLENGSVYNFDEEYRPKLFKRVREFIWEGAVHETVRTQPFIYDSDIVIIHKQEKSHADRDLQNFKKQIANGVRLTKRLHHMYALELYIAGTKDDFISSAAYFEQASNDVERDSDEIVESCIIVAKAARLTADVVKFFKYTMKIIATQECSEVCCELGTFYEEQGDFEEAVIWYYNAAYETEPVLKLESNRSIPLSGLVRCYEAMGIEEQADAYRQALDELKTNKKNK